MTKNRGYTDADMAEVSDNPEWTKARLAKARPFREVFPDLAASIRRDGVQVAPADEFVSLPLDSQVIEHFKGTGPGWETRINETLRKAIGL